MKLTTYTDYAFRTLIFLALRPDEPCTIQELADSYGISRNHLMKVVQQLGQLGYVETSRGRGGGIRLGKAPGEIRLGEVVRRTEDDMNIVECFNPADDRCAISRACRLRGILGEAMAAWLGVLDDYTLADLVDNERALARVIRLQPPARG
jgi:Rrf2 family transcriptional regulator, nitric oxide-sensitive transcriptional repressor